MRRRVGAVNTSEMLLIGGAVLAVVLLIRNRTMSPTVVTIPSGSTSTGNAQASEVNTIATQSGSVLNNLIDALS